MYPRFEASTDFFTERRTTSYDSSQLASLEVYQISSRFKPDVFSLLARKSLIAFPA
jgi:hypothetical protein